MSLDRRESRGVEGSPSMADDVLALQGAQHEHEILGTSNVPNGNVPEEEEVQRNCDIRSEDESSVFSDLQGLMNVGANMEVVLNIEGLRDRVSNTFPEDLINEHSPNTSGMDEIATKGQQGKQPAGLALWVKWRGKWQPGIQCSIDDCPSATVKAMPTYGRKTYIVVYFPNTRSHCWTDSQLACTISEKPEPLAFGTHESGQELVKDLGAPRRYMLQKLAVAMLDASDQLHVEAVVESSRNVHVWKEFAKEAAQCTLYSDLGRMLLKLHSMIMKIYISHSWMNTFDLWKQHCENAETAESTEKLIKELVDAILWDDVAKLWEAPVQPGLGSEWKTWKKEVMQWFSTSNPILSGSERNFDRDNREGHGRMNDFSEPTNLEVGKKRQKLEVRRPEAPTSEAVNDSNCYQFYAPGEVFYSPFVPYTCGYPLVPYADESTPLTDELGMKNQSIERMQASQSDHGYRRCSAFMEKKGRKCNRWASDGDIYCCKHLDFHSPDNINRVDHIRSYSVNVQTDHTAPTCQGMTKYGRKCTHRTRNGTSFCLKHMLQNGHNIEGPDGTPSSSTIGNSHTRIRSPIQGQSSEKDAALADLHFKEISQNEPKSSPFQDAERVSGSSARKWDEGSRAGERRQWTDSQSQCLSVPEKAAAKVPHRSVSWNRCIGSCRNHGGQCSHRAKQGSSYCEKHLPGSVGHGGRLCHKRLSLDYNGIFKSTSSDEDEINFCRQRDLLHQYLRACLSEETAYHSDHENKGVDWVLEEVSKDINDAKALLKMVSVEKEKLSKYFGFEERVKDVAKIDKIQEHIGSAAVLDIGRAVQIPMNGMVDSVTIGRHAPSGTQNQNCKGCGQSFPDLQALSQHCITVHTKAVQWHFRGYACRNCSSSFTNKKGLERHVKIHHSGISLEQCMEYFCIPCGSRFMNCDQLWQHVVLSHVEELIRSVVIKEQMKSIESFIPLESKQGKQDEPAISGSFNQELSCELDFPCKLENNHNHLPTRKANKGSGEKKSFVRDGVQKFCCRFCGLKFSLLPDLGRHHQAEHMDLSSKYNSHLSKGKQLIAAKWAANRVNFRVTKTSVGFKRAAVIARKKRFKKIGLQRAVREKGGSRTSEQSEITFRPTESYCSAVAEMLLSEGQKTRPWPNNLEILNVARLACCRVNLLAALEEMYGTLPERLYIKASRLCSEENISLQWHREDFICPKGCQSKADSKPPVPLAPLPDVCIGLLPVQPMQVNGCKLESKETETKEMWETIESHVMLTSSGLKRNYERKTFVLLEDLSFGQEPVPIPCVVDEDIMDPCSCALCKDNKCHYVDSYRPWETFSYITERLLDPSLGLDTKSSQLGCTCTQPQCSPESCDHVYLFENDNDNAADIYGKPMHGRFPYDKNGRIILEEGFLVYECNSMCSCQKECQNRVLQKGVQVKLEVYKTRHKGWAVRAAQAIPQGTFICEYNGEVLNDQEANKRGQRYDKEGRSYLYDIDPHIDTNEFIEGAKPYVIDATKYGNVARFINHSCSPNLVNYQVLVESMDCQLAHIGLYASKDIAVGEELAYDYHYKLLPGNGCICHCGASNCRGRLY